MADRWRLREPPEADSEPRSAIAADGRVASDSTIEELQLDAYGDLCYEYGDVDTSTKEKAPAVRQRP